MNISEKLSYKVAGHPFCIKFESSYDLRKYLPSFEPFMTDAGVDSDYIFTITCGDYEHVADGDLVYLFEWEGSVIKFYKKEDTYSLELSDETQQHVSYLHIDSEFKNARLCIDSQSANEEYILSNVIMMMYTFSVAALKTVIIHSSVIINNAHGYLFLGASGTGKSTHSALWFKHIPGSELLNDDNPILRVIDGKVYVYGSPWSGKTPCYKDEHVPVGAFLKLKQAPHNKIKKPGKLTMFGELLSSVSSMKWDSRIYDPICDTLAEISELTNLFELECLPDSDAARLSYMTIRIENN